MAKASGKAGKELAQGVKAAEAKEGKVLTNDEKMEAEWQRILEYYEPENVEKREMEALKKQLEGEKQRTEADVEREKVLEEYYGIKPKKPPDLPEGAEEDLLEETQETEREQWNFPDDRDSWEEKDLGEDWADPPKGASVPFFDPTLGLGLGDEDEDEDEAGDQPRRRKGSKKAPKAPKSLPHAADRYVAYRKGVPPLPGWLDVEEQDEPLQVLEEMEMEEEYLQWASYVFRDGSTYEGTVWNDLAQGRGVFTTPSELCKYEGEWVQNRMEGWGVLSVDIPVRLPPPDSEAWNKLKEEGKLGEEATLSEADKQWLKMELEDLTAQAEAAKKDPAIPDPTEEVPFEDDPSWVKAFGRLPEKGHYEYAGQMKQNKFHGCGVFTLNGCMHAGKFKFGEFQLDNEECNAHMSGYHASLGRVAAAKARMFVNKPDGMVREVKGPYNEPSHPYLYDEEDMWQAPGFVNDFYKVPQVWSKYVEEVDKEQTSWRNSFYKAPLRLPMPSELSYLWDKPDEFLLLRNDGPRIDGPLEEGEELLGRPEYQGEVLLHVPSRQIINWATDPSGKLRFFIQPMSKDGKIDPSQIKVLPLGFDDFLSGKGALEDSLDEEDLAELAQPRTAESAERAYERQKRREEERRKRREAVEDRELEERWAEQERELEEELKAQEEEAKALKALEDAQWERENELMEEVFEARLDALEEDAGGVPPPAPPPPVAPAAPRKPPEAKGGAKGEAKKAKVEGVAKEKEVTEATGEAAKTKAAAKEAAPKEVTKVAPPKAKETEKGAPVKTEGKKAKARKEAEEEEEDDDEEEEGSDEDEEEDSDEEEEEEEEDEDEIDSKRRIFGSSPSPGKGGKGSKPFASISMSSQAVLGGAAQAAASAAGKLIAQLMQRAPPSSQVSAAPEHATAGPTQPLSVSLPSKGPARSLKMGMARRPAPRPAASKFHRSMHSRLQGPEEIDELSRILSISFQA